MKSVVLYFIGIILFIGVYDLSQCFRLQLTPGVPTLRQYDTDYVEDIILKTRRNGRRSEYVFSVEYTTKHFWDNSNISMNFYFYEYLHNEYRPSFVELHYKVCDLVLKDMLIGPVLRKTGMTVCPIPPRRYHMMNMTFNREFPSVWPFEKGKCVLIVRLEPSGKDIVTGDLVLSFKMLKT